MDCEGMSGPTDFMPGLCGFSQVSRRVIARCFGGFFRVCAERARCCREYSQNGRLCAVLGIAGLLPECNEGQGRGYVNKGTATPTFVYYPTCSGQAPRPHPASRFPCRRKYMHWQRNCPSKVIPRSSKPVFWRRFSINSNFFVCKIIVMKISYNRNMADILSCYYSHAVQMRLPTE